MEFLLLLCSTFFFLLMFFAIRFFTLRNKIESLEFKIKHQRKIIDTLKYDLDRCVSKSDYNKLVRKANSVISDLRSNSTFTNDELKRLKHYVHPDKHNGKTNDLFVKVNNGLSCEEVVEIEF